MADIDYPSAHGTVPAYLAIPEGDGPWPAVVVLHDAMGMTEDIRRITDRFAASGYLALAPALYRRGNRVRCVVATFRASLTGGGSAVDAIVAARDQLAADPRCTGMVGSIGFCLGGGFCLQMGGGPTGGRTRSRRRPAGRQGVPERRPRVHERLALPPGRTVRRTHCGAVLFTP
jgi:dienelactone hydrolase